MGKSVVIIGGGLGGLLCGAILSKEGLDVTVLEKNAIIGGGLQSFSRFGVTFDTGMHIIGGMQKDGNVRRICEYLGIWHRLHIADVDPDNIDTVYFDEDGKSYRIAQGKNGFVDALSMQFPDQSENLRNYVDALYRIADEVGLFYLRPSNDYMQVHSEDFLLSASDFIAKYITDEHLRSVLAYLNPLYGGQEGITPAYIHSLISVLYIDGPSRFAGGSILFAETLKDFIEENGGRVLAGDGVAAVHSANKSITCVTTEKGNDYSADDYICAIHPCTFFKLLDDKAVLPKIYRSRLEDIPNSYSAFTLNIKLKPETMKFVNHTTYYMDEYDKIWNMGDTAKWPTGFLFVTPPEINQGEYSDKIIVTAPMSWKFVERWADTKVGHRGKDYEDWKAECTEKLLERMDKLIPDFRSKIESVNAASPLTIRDFYGTKEGSMYGYSKNCNDIVFSQVPVVTKVPNLFLTGQNCNLHGFCGVSLTAVNTCEAILGRNYILDKINKFDEIRPYYDSEIPDVMKRIASHPLFSKVSEYISPGEDVESVRAKVSKLETTAAFQKAIMSPAVHSIMEVSCDSVVCDGFENIDTGCPYLFVSNHRDIMLDASFLAFSIFERGYDTPEITFGANLMQGDFVIDIGKANKMFRVERPGTSSIREFYKKSEQLSEYIRTTILNKRQSIWIAQRNGRTKDGVDRTDQGIIRMFGMSGGEDPVKAIADLNIIPVSISYEWESCDILKTLELYETRLGPYKKHPGEDLNSILTGILQKKGRVSIHLCKRIAAEELIPFKDETPSNFNRQVASLIDKRICSEYTLYANNYIAKDMLDGTDRYSDHYTQAQKDAFLDHMSGLEIHSAGRDLEEMQKILLGIYASPVDSKVLFMNDEN